VGVYKLDVALVGPGYRSAFQSGLNAWNGIEQNSNRRGYIWTVAGWAGTQKFATVWSGDRSGNFNNLKMHIPTVIGAGLSGFNCSTGDIDGIFGGSALSYTRDLQWKCFTPAMMTISGWASLGKQPWVHGGNVHHRQPLVAGAEDASAPLPVLLLPGGHAERRSGWPAAWCWNSRKIRYAGAPERSTSSCRENGCS
jgi:hypothetical protein